MSKGHSVLVLCQAIVTEHARKVQTLKEIERVKLEIYCDDPSLPHPMGSVELQGLHLDLRSSLIQERRNLKALKKATTLAIQHFSDPENVSKSYSWKNDSLNSN